LRDYLLSLPERVVRSASALAGGLVREIGELALPLRLRRTRLYRSLVDDTLRFLIENIGQVEGAYAADGRLAENFALRRAAGNGIELAGVLAFRASPVWVLAALADLSGAGRELIPEIAAALKQQGLLPREPRFESMDQLLDGLEQGAGHLAETINTPPLDVPALRREWAALRQLPRPSLPGFQTVRASWETLLSTAREQDRSVFELSSLIALSAVRCTGKLVAQSLLDHYREALLEIHRTGYLAYWVREFRPYLRAAAGQFSPGRQSLTERLLRRKAGNTPPNP